MTPEQLQAQITALQEGLSKTVADQLAAQQASFQATLDERLKPVEGIQETLEKARQATIAQQEAARQQQQGQQPGWKPSTWDDIPKLVDERAQQIANQTLNARDQADQRRVQQQQSEEAELEAQLDRQLVALEQSGYLPAVGNPNDYNDPGVSARRELMSAAENMRTMELDKVADTLGTMHRSNMMFDPNTKTYVSAENSMTPLPGKFAPVGNSSTSSPNNTFVGPTVKELHSMNMDDLAALAERRGYGPVPTSVVDQPGGF